MINKRIIISVTLFIVTILCVWLFLYYYSNKVEVISSSDKKKVNKNNFNVRKEINIPRNLSEEKIIFNKYFKKINEIQLDEKILVGVVSKLDIDADGNLLVTDNVGKNVYLFDKNGSLLKTLSADACKPGFNWNPLYAQFKKDNEILLVNSGPWGFRFKNNGDCLGDMDQTFLAPLHVCFKNNGNIIGYYNYSYNSGAYLEEMDSLGKAIKRFGLFPKEFKNIISRLEGGGIVCDDNNNIYQLDVISPLVTKYNPNGQYLTTIFRAPSYFKKINEDIKDFNGNPMELMKQVRNLFENKTISYSLQMLDKDKIMIQLLNNKKYGIEIFDLDGKFLLNDELTSNLPIIAAKNGYIYIVKQPGIDKFGNIPNPIIEMYKFIFKENL